MNKVDVKVVIGSNYGDECKGLATHYFSQQAKNNNKLCLNVLYNGGCQRGHTVELKNGARHIFHHFGSGTYDAAHTYFDKDFMVNPMVFVKEINDLYSNEIEPVCFISPECRVTTPYDIFINQIVEMSRDKNRHGSCGYGIWETQQRYETSEYNLSFSQLISKTDSEIIGYLSAIAQDYFPRRLKLYGIESIPHNYKDLVASSGLIAHYTQDLRDMERQIRQISFEDLGKWYQVIIFEGAQGLALDENNVQNYPYVTASKTTSYVPVKRVKEIDCNIELCYITRSYFTRHGNGVFPTECSKAEINAEIIDKTNVYNDYQQSIRYGKFDFDEFYSRVNADITNSKRIKNDIRTSIFVTHLNYTNGDICGNCNIDDLTTKFDRAYMSSSRYAEDIFLH